MLLTCKVYRKRNSNVTPLTSSRDTATHGRNVTHGFTSYGKKNMSPKKHHPLNATQNIPNQQSLNEYLDNLSYENAGKR